MMNLETERLIHQIRHSPFLVLLNVHLQELRKKLTDRRKTTKAEILEVLSYINCTKES